MMSAINLSTQHLCAACLLNAWHPLCDGNTTSYCGMVLLPNKVVFPQSDSKIYQSEVPGEITEY